VFKQFGYIPGEDCFQSGDEDGNGLEGCADPQCYYDPFCSGITTYDPSSDTTSPSVVWLEEEPFDTGAMIFFDTNKPSNGTLFFYLNDSECGILNSTVYDVGTYQQQNAIVGGLNEYKMWHDTPLDNFAFNPQKLGFSLVNGTKYYYKTKVCGLNDKCSTSSCLDFTTADTSSFKDCPKCNPVMDFSFSPPPGFSVTDPFGQMDFFIKGANDAAFSEVPDYCGLQLNWANLTNADWKLTNGNSTKDWAITVGNASLATLDDADKSVNGSNLLLKNSSDLIDFVGMKKVQWEMHTDLVQVCLDLRMQVFVTKKKFT